MNKEPLKIKLEFKVFLYKIANKMSNHKPLVPKRIEKNHLVIEGMWKSEISLYCADKFQIS